MAYWDSRAGPTQTGTTRSTENIFPRGNASVENPSAKYPAKKAPPTRARFGMLPSGSSVLESYPKSAARRGPNVKRKSVILLARVSERNAQLGVK